MLVQSKFSLRDQVNYFLHLFCNYCNIELTDQNFSADLETLRNFESSLQILKEKNDLICSQSDISEWFNPDPHRLMHDYSGLKHQLFWHAHYRWYIKCHSICIIF